MARNNKFEEMYDPADWEDEDNFTRGRKRGRGKETRREQRKKREEEITKQLEPDVD